MSKIINISDLQKGVRDTFLQKLSPEDLQKKLGESYLGILANDETLANPFGHIPAFAQDNISQYIVWLMSQPDYFYFLIKIIFQMKTYPLQCLMLKELYTHKFPLLLATRGGSKCVTANTYIQTTCGIKQIGDLGIRDIHHIQQPINESLYGEKTYSKIEYGWYNGKKETRKITTRSGRSIECTLNHPLRVVSNGEIIWKDAEHLKIGDYLVVQRKYEQWKNYKSLDKDVAYMIGAMVGDGCYSNKTGVIQFTNIDGDCVENVNKGLYNWVKASLRKGKAKSFQYSVECDNFRPGELKKKFWNEFGAKSYNGGDDKETPKIIMGAHFDSISAYLQGLFDTDGCCHTNKPIAEFSTKSKKLADETQLLLLVLGVNSRLKKTFNKKYSKYYYKILISGNSLREFKDKVGFRIKRKQDILVKHCLQISNNNVDLIPRELFASKLLTIRKLAKDCNISSGHAYNYARSLVNPTRIKSYNMSIESFGKALDILSKSESVRNSKEYKDLREIQDSNYIYDKIEKIEKGFEKTYDVHLEGDDHSFITNGFISHNSYALAMYLLMKMLLTPGVKCVITGAGFRQAKVVFEYMEQIHKKSKMLQSCFPGKRDGPNHGTDVWTFRLGDSITYALPVGPDGSKIRGYRANCLISEEFASINRQVFEEVMSGFLSVAASPVEQVQYNAMITTMKKLYIPISDELEDSGIIQNQLILSGTAYYKYNHFYQYFSKWRQILYTRGDKKKLRDILGVEQDLSNFNWKDYSIIRIPVEKMPKGFMDMDQINRTRASSTKDVYMREFACCLHPSTKILTTEGPKRIKDIRVGDKVLTHKGRFKAVNKLTHQKTDHLLEMKFYGNNKNMYVTENHPIYVGGDGFTAAGDTKSIVFTPISKNELSNIDTIDLRDYIDENEYNQYGNFIRSKHGFTILNNSQIKEIFGMFKAGSKKSKISKKLNIKYNIVSNALNFKAFNKLNPKVKVDYNLGLIFGYYSAEGNLAADDRAVSFNLDGHVDKKLTDMVDELANAIKKSFGIVVKKYNKGNIACVNINNKIIAKFIKQMCAGNCYNKIMNHRLLFSNEKFMEGFVVGFWNGDGHRRDNTSKAQICSENLMTQVRLVLSYFGVPSSYYTVKGGCCFFRGKKFINSNRFKSEMFCNNNNLFLNKFYGQNNTIEMGQSKYYLENNEISYKLKSRKKIKFNGYVYNLEVDDDHSYHTEFGCVHNCFSDDSDGFFKRSLINSCTVNEFIPIIKDRQEVKFQPALYGDPNKKYVYGVDPAYQGDNFAIVILEVYESHRRVVHCWTTQASDHKERLKLGIVTENDYYHYCVKKIRTLMKRFPCSYIALDSGGGGNAIMEAFMDTTKLEPGEEVILPIIDPEDKPKETDFMQGEHIIHAVKFSSEWITEANHALKKDMETKDLIFPYHDSISYAEAEFYDESMGEHASLYDTLEDCVTEIEELKNELSTIAISETATGKEKFDTPDIKTGIAKKGRLKKDRYSALLLANWVARTYDIFVTRRLPGEVMTMSGAFDKNNPGACFLGNSKIIKSLNDLYS